MLESPPPSSWRIALPRGATAVPIARAMVRCALQDLGTTADRTTAQLLTAELVANALKHTRDGHPIELVVERGPDGCRVEVHDGDAVLFEGLGESLPMAIPLALALPLPAVGPGEPVSMTGTGASLAISGPDTPSPLDEPGDERGDGPGDVPVAVTAPPAPAPVSAPTPAIRSRGLLLVRSLSSASGCRRTGQGKAVWFTLPEVHRPRRR
ncbi:ATP-binding protein [Streptomyces sp. NRRL S-337]|uniref:ATP-binding protein n=1 Tax=Streptomyces sp. NRRL S-337 TaxID=1463900 RepID=UPI0004CA43D7